MQPSKYPPEAVFYAFRNTQVLQYLIRTSCSARLLCVSNVSVCGRNSDSTTCMQSYSSLSSWCQYIGYSDRKSRSTTDKCSALSCSNMACQQTRYMLKVLPTPLDTHSPTSHCPTSHCPTSTHACIVCRLLLSALLTTSSSRCSPNKGRQRSKGHSSSIQQCPDRIQ